MVFLLRLLQLMIRPENRKLVHFLDLRLVVVLVLKGLDRHNKLSPSRWSLYSYECKNMFSVAWKLHSFKWLRKIFPFPVKEVLQPVPYWTWCHMTIGSA